MIAFADENLSIVLGNGSLLWMGPGTQENYQHCVPQVNGVKMNGRINLTFRKFNEKQYKKRYLA